jgi:2-(1,2-epoxy-1,2-dihydrophenyl)acetyl-CoA isomerase
MSAFATLRYEVRDAVALITLNRPTVMNAFDRQMRLDMRAAAERANADAGVRAVVLTGEGRAFSAGADLGDVADDEAAQVQRILEEEYKPALLAIARSPKP